MITAKQKYAIGILMILLSFLIGLFYYLTTHYSAYKPSSSEQQKNIPKRDAEEDAKVKAAVDKMNNNKVLTPEEQASLDLRVAEKKEQLIHEIVEKKEPGDLRSKEDLNTIFDIDKAAKKEIGVIIPVATNTPKIRSSRDLKKIFNTNK